MQRELTLGVAARRRERHCLSQLHSEKNGECSVKSVKNVFISLKFEMFFIIILIYILFKHINGFKKFYIPIIIIYCLGF